MDGDELTPQPAPDALDLVAPVTLVTGPEEFLADRAVASITARARELDPSVQLRRLSGAQVEPGALLELTSPSLFADRTVLVIDAGHELTPRAAVAVAELVRRPLTHVQLVVAHSGQSNRAKPVLDACRSTHAREISCAKVTKASERVEFVKSEARAAGRRLNTDAAQLLVDAVGSDLRELAAACAQLVSDTDEAITPQVVARYYEGRAEVSSFQVADLAVQGRTSEALGQLRHALGSGVAPVLVTSALAQALRSIGRVASAPRGARAADLARDLGLPPWKVDMVRRQVRGWTADGLAGAITAVAAADAAVKGANGAGDSAYALEKALVTVGSCRAG